MFGRHLGACPRLSLSLMLTITANNWASHVDRSNSSLLFLFLLFHLVAANGYKNYNYREVIKEGICMWLSSIPVSSSALCSTKLRSLDFFFFHEPLDFLETIMKTQTESGLSPDLPQGKDSDKKKLQYNYTHNEYQYLQYLEVPTKTSQYILHLNRRRRCVRSCDRGNSEM